MIDLITFMFFNNLTLSVISLLFFATCILSVEYEKEGVGLASFIIYIILTWFVTDINPFIYMWNNKLSVFYFITSYFAIGVVYSCIKYNNWLTERLQKIIELRKLFLISIETSGKEDTDDEWLVYVRQEIGFPLQERSLYFKENLKPSENKKRFIGWIAYWPFSAIGLFLSKPLERLVNFLYDNVIGVCNKIYENKIKSMMK